MREAIHPAKPRSWDRLILLAAACCASLLGIAACAPPASMRPLASLGDARQAEVGAAFAGVGPRPYAVESWQAVGQAWGTYKVSSGLDLSAVTAFDTTAFALGGAARLTVLRDSRFALGAELEAGWLWTAFALHMRMRLFDEVLLYAAPRIGNWGDDWTPGIPFGLSVPIVDGFALRAEAQVNWAGFAYYNRRWILAGALVYQW